MVRAAPELSLRSVRSPVAQSLARTWNEDEVTRGSGLRSFLSPFELAFRAAVWGRNGAYDVGLLRTVRLNARVISVGNLVVGGTGKTPVSAWLAAQVARRGHRAAVLHGGYGLDEPALHRLWNPGIVVVVDRDRVAAGRRAIAQGATMLVLDDGFQHRRLMRDLDVVLIPAESWRLEPRLLPRGPWREGLAALRRATLLIVTRKTASPEVAASVARALAVRCPNTPVAMVALRPAGWRRGDGLAGTPDGVVLAVAAVAQPALFVANAREAGTVVGGVLSYRDHHAYSDRDLESIVTAAHGRPIVTTEKDWIKLEGRLDARQVWRLLQRVEVEAGGAALEAHLDGLAQ